MFRSFVSINFIAKQISNKLIEGDNRTFCLVIRSDSKMPVVLVVTNRTWTSVNATELNDHILCDGIFEGPTFITRDEFGIPPEEITLYKSINAHKVHDMTYSTNLKAATVLSKFSIKFFTIDDERFRSVLFHR